MKSLLLFALVLPACLAKPLVEDDMRIVGGHVAARGQFPHQVSIQIQGQHSCGGSIIAPNKILTAAHCVYGMNQPMTVVAGINNLGEQGQQIGVAQALYHASYDPQTTMNDVAMLHLSSSIQYNNLVQPIQLRQSSVGAGETLTLSGWGKTSHPGNIPRDLMTIDLRNIDLQSCSAALQGFNPITTGHVCTSSPQGQGACHGDSGGPLIDGNGQQVGVVSWGVPCAQGYPDVFTSVPFYYNWIQSA